MDKHRYIYTINMDRGFGFSPISLYGRKFELIAESDIQYTVRLVGNLKFEDGDFYVELEQDSNFTTKISKNIIDKVTELYTQHNYESYQYTVWSIENTNELIHELFLEIADLFEIKKQVLDAERDLFVSEIKARMDYENYFDSE